MTQLVTIPDVGDFEFPDGMSQSEMQSAIQSHLGGTPSQQTTPATKPSLAGKIGRAGAGLGLGALQGVAQLGHGLGELETGGVNKLMALLGHPTHFHAPEPDVFAGPAAQLKGGLPARIGETAGQLGGIAALGGGVGGAAKMAGAAPWLAESLGFGAAGAATTPGGAGERAIAGGVGAALPIAGRGAIKTLRAFLPKHLSVTKLAQLVTKTKQEQESLGGNLYKESFKGTQNIKPRLSAPTVQSLGDSQSLVATHADVNKALKTFYQNPTLEGLHFLKSDFGKMTSKLDSKELKSGLSQSEINKRSLLNESSQNIHGDLDRNMSNVSPDAYSKYLGAQKHWRENVVPFNTYNSVKKLLGKDHEISRTLFTDLAKRADSAKRLRELMNLDRGALGGKGLRRAAGLGVLGGLGIGGHHYLHALLGGY
jgi:hypothetical protein